MHAYYYLRPGVKKGSAVRGESIFDPPTLVQTINASLQHDREDSEFWFLLKKLEEREGGSESHSGTSTESSSEEDSGDGSGSSEEEEGMSVDGTPRMKASSISASNLVWAPRYGMFFFYPFFFFFLVFLN